jgi:predicted nucleotidyltransferase
MEDVRRILRRSILLFDDETIRDELRITTARARRLAKALLQAGYIRDVRRPGERAPSYERTVEGSALAGATMAPALHRSTAERLLEEVVERARAINEDDAYVYRVARIELFGSVLGNNPRPNDVDLAVTLSRRHADPDKQERAERVRRRAASERGRRFRNMTDEAFWPQTEVLLALRGRARGLSLSEGGTPARLGAKTKVIFEGSRPRRVGKRRRQP